MSYSLFADAASEPGHPINLSVPYLLAAISHVDDCRTQLYVANDGYLIALATPEDNKPVVTAWVPEGQGRGHGRPVNWRQNYRREFASSATAKDRVEALLAKHGGHNTTRASDS